MLSYKSLCAWPEIYIYHILKYKYIYRIEMYVIVENISISRISNKQQVEE